MQKRTTKLAKLREAWAKGDKIGALRIASRFHDRSAEPLAFQRGWNAHQNADFYRQLGKNPEEIICTALAALAGKFKFPL